MKFGHIFQADICHLRKCLECQQILWRMSKAAWWHKPRRLQNGQWNYHAVRNHFFSDDCRELGICHAGICSRDKGVPAVFTEKRCLWHACPPVTDHLVGTTGRAGRLCGRFFCLQHTGSRTQQGRYFIFCKFFDITDKHFLIGRGIILLNMGKWYLSANLYNGLKWSTNTFTV